MIKPKVMCVDDDLLFLKSIGDDQCFTSQYDFYSCSDAGRAVTDIKVVKPDVVFLDIMMPGGGGFEVLKGIRGSLSTRSIPVVMLTAVSSFEARVSSLRLYSEGYLEKPCTASEIAVKTKETLLERHNIGKMLLQGENNA
jgi:DNA-binding response OmpR family regulator